MDKEHTLGAEADDADFQAGSEDAPVRPTIRAIYEEIRRRICMVTYPYGAILRESELAEDFGVSRTPVREALQRLKADGLVETRHGVGNFVIAGDRKTFEDIYGLRIETAELIGKLAHSPCPPEATARMAALRGEITARSDNLSFEQFWDLNERRHRIINDLIENREFALLHDLFYHKVAPFWFSLCSVDFELEVDILEHELRETVFWMETGDMKSVATIHRNFTAYGIQRIRNKLGAEPR